MVPNGLIKKRKTRIYAAPAVKGLNLCHIIRLTPMTLRFDCGSEVLGSNRDRVRCLSSGLCIYSAPNCQKAWNVPCSLYHVHYKETLTLLHNSIGPSPDFVLPFVAIMP